MIKEGAVLEYTEYCGNYYGTLRESVDSLLSQGKDAILKIEIEGAMNIKKLFPDCCLVFILPPSIAELERRLRSRGTETEDVIRGRLCRAAEEAACMDRYDYILVNDDLDICVKEMHDLIQSQHRRTSGSQELIDAIKAELNNTYSAVLQK